MKTIFGYQDRRELARAYFASFGDSPLPKSETLLRQIRRWQAGGEPKDREVRRIVDAVFMSEGWKIRTPRKDSQQDPSQGWILYNPRDEDEFTSTLDTGIQVKDGTSRRDLLHGEVFFDEMIEDNTSILFAEREAYKQFEEYNQMADDVMEKVNGVKARLRRGVKSKETAETIAILKTVTIYHVTDRFEREYYDPFTGQTITDFIDPFQSENFIAQYPYRMIGRGIIKILFLGG